MTTIERLRCSKCGDVKPPSEFYRNAAKANGHESQCKVCHRQQILERREAMGEEAWLAHTNESTRRSRERTGNERGKAWNRARNRAITRLIGKHRSEFDGFMATELRREER